MKKIFFLVLLFSLIVCHDLFAQNTPIIVGDTVSAHGALSITTNVSTQNRCRAVWIGTTQSVDFFFSDSSAWVTFQGATAGTLLPIQVTGARKTAGTAAPTSGDIVFLY